MTPFMRRRPATSRWRLRRQFDKWLAALAILLAGLPASSSAGVAALAATSTPQAGEPLVLTLAYGGTSSVSTGTTADGTRATATWHETEIYTIPSHLPRAGKPSTFTATFTGSASFAMSSSSDPSSNYTCTATPNAELAHQEAFAIVGPMYSDMTNTGLTDPAAIARQTISYNTFAPHDIGGKADLLEDQDSGNPQCRGIEGRDVLLAAGAWQSDPTYVAASQPNGLITESSLDPSRGGSPLTRIFKVNGTKDDVTVSLNATLTISERVTPAPVALQIRDVLARAPVTGATVTKIVGQHILLEVTSSTGATVEDIKWSIPSGLPNASGVAAVHDYPIETATSSLKPTYLETGNLNNYTVSFYWVKPAPNYDVTVDGTVDGKPAKQAAVTYIVEAPSITMNS